uniref:PDZ domain-containing protein n=1 Tax=Chaetoceros debilis TaxID=122233 RepID=A0A7S3VBC4_9STRA|mmetsp:Transcript_30432/g.46583  ORF Transcript_30432/g.46583 Transcript_30432/m.46583 type:complete len:1236 (-) Transcript_30432:231-3938(-)
MMEDFDSGDESSTTTLGDENSIPLLPQITNQPPKDGNSKSLIGGDNGGHDSDGDSPRAAEQMKIPANQQSSNYSCANRNGGSGSGSGATIDTPPRKALTNTNMDRMTGDNLSEHGGGSGGPDIKADLSNRSPLSPATQTLNELSGMDVKGDNLMYDMSQLSQLPLQCQNLPTIDESRSGGGPDLESGPKKKLCCHLRGSNIYLGSSNNQSDGLKRVKQAKDKIAEWESQNRNRGALKIEWVKDQLEKLNIRVLSKPVNFVSKQKDVLTKSLAKNICDEVIEECAATEIVEIPLVGQKPSSHRQVLETYSTHIINLPEKGSFGMNLQSGIAEGSGRIVPLVSKLRVGGQAEKYGVKLDDLIYIAPKGTRGRDTTYRVDGDSLEPARIRDIVAWANSDPRPVTFVVRRLLRKSLDELKNDANSKHIYNEEKDRIKCTKSHDRNKDGVTSKRSHQDEIKLNSSITRDQIKLALNGKGYPQIPCCRKCKYSKVNNHHYLCPKHQDFTFSGAKDKLTMLFAGMYDGCRACAAEVETGRKSRIPHNKKCEDIDKGGTTKRKSRKKISAEPAREKKNIKQPKQLKTSSISKTPGLKGAERASTKKREPSRGKGPHRDSSRIDKNPTQSNSKGVASPIQITRKENLSKKHRKRKEVASQKSTIASSKPPKRDGISQRDTKSNNHRLAHITPSRCSNVNKEKKEKVALQITDDHSLPKWVPCHNPWGSRGHCEGDFILFSPSDYKQAFEINGGSRPKRFVCDPFSSSLSYQKSHVTPKEGLRVLELSRDRLALRSWGFSFCHHDFGGACLVTCIDKLSPADAASDLGDSEGYHQGLQVNDLILCINGKKVDGMTVVDLEVELEISNSQILLVVAQCRTPIDTDTHDQSIHPHHCLGELLHWTETGLKANHSQSESTACVNSVSMDVVPNTSSLEGLPVDANAIDDSKNTKEVGSQSHSRTLSEKYDSCHAQSFVQNDTSFRLPSPPPSDTEESSVEKIQPSRCIATTDLVNKSTYTSLHIRHLPQDTKDAKKKSSKPAKEILEKSAVGNQEQIRHETDWSSEAEPEWEDDENPWLGCVCGEIHESPAPVFWIQCDGCDAWFNCAPACIGFDKQEALEKSDWECAECTICDETHFGSNLSVEGKVTPMKSQYDARNYETSPLPIGSVVNVEARLGTGSNKPGGVGRITDYRVVNDGKVIDRLYDIRYVLGGTELEIESKYVSVNATTRAAMDLCSPRSTRSRGSV